MSLKADHSTPHLYLFNENKYTIGNGFWKFNRSLIEDHMYVAEIKHLVSSFLSNDISNINFQIKRKLLKYETKV